MIIKIILFALAIGLFAKIARMIMKSRKYKTCSSCQGKGFWQGTRGDKNTCKICDGQGYVDKKDTRG